MAARPTIIFPTVPEREGDPRVRVNTMIKMFDDSRIPGQATDTGFLFEILTAVELVRDGIIHHGREISRPLTAKEKAQDLPGHSQMIRIETGGGHFRELDIVYQRNNIVEAKNRRTTETSQMEQNIDLAIAIGGTVTYALPLGGGREQPRQQAAYVAAYNRIMQARNLTAPQIQILAVPSGDLGRDYPGGVAYLLTEADRQQLEEDGGMDSF